MLDHDEAGARLVPDVQQQRRQRLCLTLGDAGRRLVEQQHVRLVGQRAGEIDDPPAAGRQLEDELVGERPEPHEPDQVIDLLLHFLLGRLGGRRVEGRCDRVAHREVPLERNGDRLVDRHRRKEPCVLERTAETMAGPGVGRQLGDVCPAEKDVASVGYQESRDQVEDNFRRYGLLDDRVKFLVGWFKDSLRAAPISRLAVLRLDGDLYESTIQALNALYDKLSPGGYVIVDDYQLATCAKAIHDFRKARGINDEIHDIDGMGVFWRRSK